MNDKIIEITIKYGDTDLTRRYAWEDSVLPEVWGEHIVDMVNSIKDYSN